MEPDTTLERVHLVKMISQGWNFWVCTLSFLQPRKSFPSPLLVLPFFLNVVIVTYSHVCCVLLQSVT